MKVFFRLLSLDWLVNLATHEFFLLSKYLISVRRILKVCDLRQLLFYSLLCVCSSAQVTVCCSYSFPLDFRQGLFGFDIFKISHTEVVKVLENIQLSLLFRALIGQAPRATFHSLASNDKK